MDNLLFLCEKPNDIYSEYDPNTYTLSPCGKYIAYYYYFKTNKKPCNDNSRNLVIMLVELATNRKDRLYEYHNIDIKWACLHCTGPLKLIFCKNSQYLICDGYNWTHGDYAIHQNYINIYRVADQKLIYSTTYNNLLDNPYSELLHYSAECNTLFYGDFSRNGYVNVVRALSLNEYRDIITYHKTNNCSAKSKHIATLNLPARKKTEDKTLKCEMNSIKLICNLDYVVFFIDNHLYIFNLKTSAWKYNTLEPAPVVPDCAIICKY